MDRIVMSTLMEDIRDKLIQYGDCDRERLMELTGGGRSAIFQAVSLLQGHGLVKKRRVYTGEAGRPRELFYWVGDNE